MLGRGWFRFGFKHCSVMLFGGMNFSPSATRALSSPSGGHQIFPGFPVLIFPAVF